MKNNTDECKVLQYIEENEPVSQEQIEEDLGRKTALSAMKTLMRANRISYDRKWRIMTEDRNLYCNCESPTVNRTLAKGTPAEKRYCSCGGKVE